MQDSKISMTHPRRIGVATAGLVALLASTAWATPGGLDRLSAADELAMATDQPEMQELPATAEPAGSRALFTVGPQANCDFNNLQSAINQAGNGDTIRVAANDGYLGQVYYIHAKSLTIQGGYSSCDLSATANGRTVFNAQGSTGRVFDIWDFGNTPMTVRLENLELQGGNGGLLVEGQLGRLAVQVANVWIQGNHASNTSNPDGGGVRVRITSNSVGSSTSEPILSLDNDTVIAQNSAIGDGGGLYCSSSLAQGQHIQTSVRIGAALIMSNDAQGNGGGVASVGCQRLFMYTGGPVALFIPTGGVMMNTAGGNGGGLYVSAGGEVQVRGDSYSGFGLDLAPMINGNEAVNGGGIAITGQSSRVGLHGAQVHGNNADEVGGGILVTDHASLNMRALSETDPCLPTQTGGGLASAGPCSYLRNNRADRTGAAIKVRNGADARITQTRISNNQIPEPDARAGVIAVNYSSDRVSEPASLLIDSSQVDGNKATYVAYVGNGSDVAINWSTVADNEIVGRIARSFALPGKVNTLFLGSSIFWGNSSNSMVNQGGDGSHVLSADCVIGQAAAGNTGLTGQMFYESTDPLFIAPDDGDYRLAAGSPAIDFCDGVTDSVVSRDLAGNPRNQVWTGPPPASNPGLGHYDLGAFEAHYDDDVIFANGFE